MIGHNLPLHALSWFVGATSDFFKTFAEGQVMADGVLNKCISSARRCEEASIVFNSPASHHCCGGRKRSVL